jgi:hypothetical protein
MKLLIENFKRFLTEADWPGSNEELQMFKDWICSKELADFGLSGTPQGAGECPISLGEYLGRGGSGIVFQIAADAGPGVYAIKIITGNKEKEVTNYKWIMANRDKLDKNVASVLPIVYHADMDTLAFAGQSMPIGVVLMELLEPDVHKINLDIMFDDEGGVSGRKAERLFMDGNVRYEIAKNTVGVMVQEFESAFKGIENPKIIQMYKDVAQKTSDEMGRLYLSSGNLNLKRVNAALKLAERINWINDLQEAEPLVKVFVLYLINYLENSEMGRLLKDQLPKVREELQKRFDYSYKSSAEIPAASDQRTQGIEQLPEAASFLQKLKALAKIGFKWVDIKAANVMYRAGSKEMVVADVGHFEIAGPSESKVSNLWNVMLEGWNSFFEENL